MSQNFTFTPDAQKKTRKAKEYFILQLPTKLFLHERKLDRCGMGLVPSWYGWPCVYIGSLWIGPLSVQVWGRLPERSSLGSIPSESHVIESLSLFESWGDRSQTGTDAKRGATKMAIEAFSEWQLSVTLTNSTMSFRMLKSV